MGLVRDIAGEVIKALLVLALVFLSFGHTPVQAGSVGDDASAFALADLSYCGAPSDDGNGAHAPCHACRAGIADLPQPPCVSEPAYSGFQTAAFSRADSFVVAQSPFALPSPRGPPAII